MVSLELLLAPLLGIVGGVIPGWLTNRREKGAWLRDKRYEAYSQFLSTCLELHSMLGTEMRRALECKDRARTAKLVKQSNLLSERMCELAQTLEIIAPTTVAEAAAKVVIQLGTTVIAAVPVQLSNVEFYDEGWLKTLHLQSVAISDFQIAAGRDLGLSRRDIRRRRKQRVTPEIAESNQASAVRLLRDLRELWTDGTTFGVSVSADEAPINYADTRQVVREAWAQEETAAQGDRES
jgi:hypothetical protein